MTTYKTTLFGLVLAGALLIPGSPVWAKGPEKDPNFQKNHPRQTQTLKRVDRERTQVNHLYKQGKLSAQQRNQQLGQLHAIRKEDYADAKANSQNGRVRGGYITKGQQRGMNQQENQIRQEIRQDAK
jgi:hypothetical protein